MRGRGLWLVGLAAIVLAMPAAAPAAPQPQPPKGEVQQPLTSGVVFLGKAAGYEIAISNPSSHAAILGVSRIGEEADRWSTYSETGYAVRPRSSIGSGALHASFGSMGTVNLRFWARGKTRVGHLRPGCHGRPPQTEFGEYRGTVSLRGEDDYFQVHAVRARGTRSRSFRLDCARDKALVDKPAPLYEYVRPVQGFIVSSAGGSIALLRAVSRYGGRLVYLRAAHMQGEGAGAEVQVGALERRPGMAIGHSAYADGGEGTLLTSLPGVHPATATLAPPAPFHGEGSFVENSPTSHSWTGSLAVSFPGLDLPLAGHTFATSLCVESPFKTRVPCDFRNLPRVPE
ncbi:MAG: hypothetical protein ACTHNY_08995 [Solirubrobacterales bacterium]